MKFFTKWLGLVGLGALLAGPAVAQPAWQWAKVSGGTGTSTSVDAVLDGVGNTVVAGNFTGTVTFGNSTLTSAGMSDVFVAWLDPAGNWQRAVRAGGSGFDSPHGIALDPNGDIVMAGSFSGATTTFGSLMLRNNSSSSNPNPYDGFVARLTRAGNWVQAVQVGGLDEENVSDVVIDGTGLVTVTGYFGSSQLQLGNTTLTNQGFIPGTPDIYVAQLSRAGTWINAQQAGGPGADYAYALALAPGGGTVISASINAPATFGTIALTSPQGRNDIVIARLSSAGVWTQAVAAGGTNDDYGSALTVDTGNNVTVVGAFDSPNVAFGPLTIQNANAVRSSDGFVARLNSAGTWTLALAVGGMGFDSCNALATTTTGDVVVTGGFASASLSFGSTTLANSGSSGSSDIFLARVTSTGVWTNALRAGGTGNDAGYACFIDANGAMTIAGVVDAPSASFGPLVVSPSSPTGYVARLAGFATDTHTPTPTEAFTLAPNPATAQARLTWPAASTAPRPVLLLDALGRQVRRTLLPARATTATLDVAGLAPGLYVVRCAGATARLMVE